MSGAALERCYTWNWAPAVGYAHVEKSAAVRVLTRGHEGDERVDSADVLNEALISYHRDCPEVPLPDRD